MYGSSYYGFMPMNVNLNNSILQPSLEFYFAMKLVTFKVHIIPYGQLLFHWFHIL